jgi:putative endonuclease
MFEKAPCVYILASRKNGTLYTGVTSNLTQRIGQHKMGVVDGFTKRYALHTLVYYEQYETMEIAILREKQIKGGSRKKKVDLIVSMNPEWNGLFFEL